MSSAEARGPQLARDSPRRLAAATKHGSSQMVPGTLDVKGTKILAKSLFKELRGNGYSPNQILSLSTELIDLVTQTLKSGHADGAANNPAALAALTEGSPAGWRAAL